MVFQIRRVIEGHHVVHAHKDVDIWHDDKGKPHRTVTYGYTYVRYGVPQSVYTTEGGVDSTQAAAAAKRERDEGFSADLVAAKVPELERLVTAWRNAAANKTQQAIFLEVIDRPFTPLDARLFVKRPTMLTGTEAKLPPEQVPFQVTNVRPYILSLFNSVEFRHRMKDRLDKPERFIKLAVHRIFNRRVEGDELKYLLDVFHRNGLVALMSCLLYSQEYEERYGSGLPCPEHDPSSITLDE